MLEEYKVPNGVGMGRLPANSLPPGFVWQAMQSPARARYSPLLVAWSLPADSAGDGVWLEGCVEDWLPQTSGVARLPAGSGFAFGCAGRLESQAASAVTSASERSPATICMQSGAMAVRVP